MQPPPSRAMTKSPVSVARMAHRLGSESFPPYSSRFSRKDFTQAQLFAILALREFFRTDFRGIIEILGDFSDLRRVLKLKKVPHYSTLCYAHERLLKKMAPTPSLTPSVASLPVRPQ